MLDAERHSTSAPQAAVSQAGRAVFISFLERDAFRQRRRRGARRTLFISLAIHLTALLALVLASFWQVDELWTPSVKVTLFPSSATPPGVTEPTPPGAPTPSGSRVR